MWEMCVESLVFVGLFVRYFALSMYEKWPECERSSCTHTSFKLKRFISTDRLSDNGITVYGAVSLSLQLCAMRATAFSTRSPRHEGNRKRKIENKYFVMSLGGLYLCAHKEKINIQPAK